MAEHVQAALDQMVAPLRDLIDRNIFSKEEVRATVARRRESEYLLRRLTARKADFLRYIEAEQALEKLRKLRVIQSKRDHRKNTENDENVKTEKQHIGDAHIIQHIHLLFVRAIRKFRSDLSLHLLHADFCKEQKSWTRLGRVYAEALQIFPRKAGLWIEAASHEFFGPSRSIRSARVLLQRGLRLNRNSEEMWVEYFSLELHYAQTLKGRRQILRGEEQEHNENEYKIAGIVYNNAIKGIPDSIPLRLRFLDTCRRFPNTESLMQSIQAPLQEDFSSHPEAWIARALYEAEKQSNGNGVTKMEKYATEGFEEHEESTGAQKEGGRPSKKARTKDPVVAVLDEAVETLETDNMKLQAFRFAQTYQDELERTGSVDGVVQVEKFIANLLILVTGHSSPDLALEHADYLVERGGANDALSLLKDFCTSQKDVPAALWIRWASMSSKSSMVILQKALHRTPISHLDHMQILLQYFGAQMVEKDKASKLFSTFQRIVVLAPTSSDLVVEDVTHLEFGIESVSHAYLKFLEHECSLNRLESARKIYSAVLFQSSLVLNEGNTRYIKAFIDRCVQLERNDKARLRRIYDKALKITKGTQLEIVYRQERDENSIYQ